MNETERSRSGWGRLQFMVKLLSGMIPTHCVDGGCLTFLNVKNKWLMIQVWSAYSSPTTIAYVHTHIYIYTYMFIVY